MINRVKSISNDEKIIYDESADPIERSDAIGRLGFDCFYEMQPLLEKLLKHSNNFIRAEAIKVLLARWGLDNYVERAIEMIHHDPNWDVRGDAVFSLVEYLKYSDKKENVSDKILKELVYCLLNDNDESVQRTCYEKFYEVVTGKYPQINSVEFDRNRNVDWSLLHLYIEKYGLQKPD